MTENAEIATVESDRSIAVSNLPTSSTSFEINHTSSDPKLFGVITLLLVGIGVGSLLSYSLFDLTVKYPVTLKPVWVIAMLLPYAGCYLLTDELHAIPTFYIGEALLVFNLLKSSPTLLQSATLPWIITNISYLLLMLSYDHVELIRPWIQTFFSGVSAIFRIYTSLSFSFEAISAHNQNKTDQVGDFKVLGYISYWQSSKLLEWFLLNLSAMLNNSSIIPQPVMAAFIFVLHGVNFLAGNFVWFPVTMWHWGLELGEKATLLLQK